MTFVSLHTHEHPKVFLVPSTVFGSTRLYLPVVSADYKGPVKTSLFNIVTSKNEELSTYQEPCHPTQSEELKAAQQSPSWCHLHSRTMYVYSINDSRVQADAVDNSPVQQTEHGTLKRRKANTKPRAQRQDQKHSIRFLFVCV